jgi:hypothetical protein
MGKRCEKVRITPPAADAIPAISKTIPMNCKRAFVTSVTAIIALTLMRMARGWIVFFRGHARHADPLAICKGVSRFYRRDLGGFDSQRAGSDRVRDRGAGRMVAGQSAGAKVGRRGQRCN